MFDEMTLWRWSTLVALGAFAINNWYQLYRLWRKYEDDLVATELFWDRHNCVVMYSRNRGITGWPNPTPPQLSNSLMQAGLYEPILYFINTAEKSIDIAMMVFDATLIMEALVKACKRGVVIRIVLDFDYSKRNRVKKLLDAGIQVMFYVRPTVDICSILHYKYMMKDCRENRGFVYVGSLNWSATGIQENYENTVFTSNPHVANHFQKNFEEVWQYVNEMSETNNYVKAKLRGLQ